MGQSKSIPIRNGGSTSYRGNTASGNSRVQYGDHYGDATYNINYSDIASPDLRTRILESLWFDSMNARQDAIEGAAPDTLDWIYERSPSTSDGKWPVEGSIRRPEWDSLATWLEEENSTYWICGKAGTGKSTLMAHIVHDSRTAEYLSVWTQSKQLHKLSFFFWRPGTDLQKSINGLLRTLLYQICDEIEAIVSVVAQVVKSRGARQLSWTDERLVDAIMRAFITTDDMFCLFLDGLDDYEGDVYMLTDLIAKIEVLSNVKVCLSSRPEAELTRRFSMCKQLRLEMLNRPGIERFVQTRLENHVHAAAFRSKSHWTLEQYIWHIVDRADGVFLWVVLVLPVLSRGLSCGDSIDLLLARLESMPTEMGDLYATLFSRVDKEHLKSLAFYFSLMKLYKQLDLELSIALVAAIRLDDHTTITSYDQFYQLCEDENLHITSQSVGLLHVVTSEQAFAHIRSCFEVPQLRSGTFAQDMRLTNLTAIAKSRKARADGVMDMTFLRHQYSFVEWIHRSAHEFVFPSDGTESPFQNMLAGPEDSRDIHHRVLIGYLRLLTFGPACLYEHRDPGCIASPRLRDTLRVYAQSFSQDPVSVSEILDQTRLIVAEMDPAEFHISNQFNPFDQDACTVTRAALFLHELIDQGCWRIVEDQLPKLNVELWRNSILTFLFWLGLYRGIEDHPSTCNVFCEHISQSVGKQTGEKSTSCIRLFFDDSEFEVFYFTPKLNNMRHTSCALSDLTSPIQPAEISHLARICLHIISKKNSCPSLSLIWDSHFKAVAETVDLYWEVPLIISYYDVLGELAQRPTRHRLLLQGNYRLMEALLEDVALRDGQATLHKGDLRIVCIPAGRVPVSNSDRNSCCFREETGFFIFEPSVSTSMCLLKEKIQINWYPECWFGRIDSWSVIDRWTRLLVDDIWENKSGLDATQQLFALACVKVGMHRWSQVRTFPILRFIE